MKYYSTKAHCQKCSNTDRKVKHLMQIQNPTMWYTDADAMLNNADESVTA